MSILHLKEFPSLDSLPTPAQALLGSENADRLFSSRIWFESFIAAGLPYGAKPAFFLLSDESGQARALLPCQRLANVRRNEAAVASLTSFYSCDFRPLIAPGADAENTAFELGRALAQNLAGEALVRFDSLDSSLPTLNPFLGGLSVSGRALLRYAHFGSWSQDVAGLAFADYLAARDGSLREVIRRKGSRMGRDGAVFSIVGPDGDIERGIKDYEAVYAESWKEAEPFPDFQPVLMRALFKAGWLRLALCHIGNRPVAAQIWVVTGGKATVLKLAHDKAFDALSPGTVLTSFAIRRLMEGDRIAMLDFGRGDDSYKRGWTTRRTQHIGVLWASVSRRPLLVARHFLGQLGRRGSPKAD